MLLSCLLFGGVTWFGLADSYENVSSGKRGDAQARFNREAFFREVEQKQPESTKDFLMLLPENERRLYSLVYRSLAENRERVSADATFQPSGGTEKPSLQWSPPNPERCMECHRKSDNSYLGPRPIVDTYFNWPGWIGSNDDGVGSKRVSSKARPMRLSLILKVASITRDIANEPGITTDTLDRI